MLPPNDRVRLEHMREACADIIEYMAGRSENDLQQDKRLRQLVTYGLLILGEAATGVSGQARIACPGIPWGQLVRTRNQLIHGYFKARPETIWVTVTRDVPKVLADLERVLKDEG